MVMDQTPPNFIVNNELLSMIPVDARRVVDVGCGFGALAKAYREINPAVFYTGIDIVPKYTGVASDYCSEVITCNIEIMIDSEFDNLFPSDCWVFGDCLEHLYDPWRILQKIRSKIDVNGCVVVCIPNAQHWSVQYSLASGNFIYSDSGLLDKTHIRWFTLKTMIDMFSSTGWRIDRGLSRKFSSPDESRVLGAIREFARAAGLDPEKAVEEAAPFQYVFKLVVA